MYVVFYEDAAGEWRWQLRAANHRTVADSAEGYSDTRGVHRAWEAVRDGLLEAGPELREVTR